MLEVTETQPTPSRTARRAAANREAIVDAAEELLVEGGLAAVTVEAVAERSDVAIQTVYNRVGRRPEVLVAVAERAVEENRRYMAPAFGSAGTPAERLAAGDETPMEQWIEPESHGQHHGHDHGGARQHVLRRLRHPPHRPRLVPPHGLAAR